MNIAIASDFNGSTGCPRESMRAIAEGGFTHLHWCHQWCTDFLYSRHEIAQIKSWLKEFDLELLDIHGSAGTEKLWYAGEEYRRKSGVELVLNRAEMLRELNGTGALMMHIPFIPEEADEERTKLGWEQFEYLCRSLDELMPSLEKLQVPIAVENMANDNFETIRKLMERYPANLMGITYDSGHGNIGKANGIRYLEPLKNRLTALHLHDNDTTGDQHQPPYYGNINWDRLLTLIAESGYPRCLSFELSMRNTPYFNPETKGPQDSETVLKFLADAYVRCSKAALIYEDKCNQLKKTNIRIKHHGT